MRFYSFSDALFEEIHFRPELTFNLRPNDVALGLIVHGAMVQSRVSIPRLLYLAGFVSAGINNR